jgi:hypothetical protein
MRLIYKTFLTMALCAGFSVSSFAQVNEEMADFTNEIEAMRTVMQTERKILIMNEMTLTADEAAKFWPLHDEYRAEVKKIGNLRVKVITDYAASYETMTDEVAKQLLDESMKFDEQRIKLEKKYVKKFRAILPNIKVTRYFQLENKLDAIIDFDLAAQIPLME